MTISPKNKQIYNNVILPTKYSQKKWRALATLFFFQTRTPRSSGLYDSAEQIIQGYLAGVFNCKILTARFLAPPHM